MEDALTAKPGELPPERLMSTSLRAKRLGGSCSKRQDKVWRLWSPNDAGKARVQPGVEPHAAVWTRDSFLTTNAFSIATKEMVFCLVDVLLRKMVIVIEFNVPLLHALNKYYLNQNWDKKSLFWHKKASIMAHNPDCCWKVSCSFHFCNDTVNQLW